MEKDRDLVTIGPKSLVWGGTLQDLVLAAGFTSPERFCEGKFFRLRPPRGNAENARATAATLKHFGALGVQVELPEEEHAAIGHEEEQGSLILSMSLRDAVMQTAEAANTADRPKMKAALERSLAAAKI